MPDKKEQSSKPKKMKISYDKIELDNENKEAINAVMKHAERYIELDKIEHKNFVEYIKKIGTETDIATMAREIIENELKYGKRFKLNLQLAYVLKDVSTGQYSLFYARY